MQGIFNYSTLDVTLLKKTRTLAIYLNRSQEDNAINLEMLFELESLLSWCTGRVEIRSILIASRSEGLSCGIDKEMITKMDTNYLEKLTLKLQKITKALIHLPQTIVIDLGNNCHNWASELSIGADIRVAREDIDFSFNHTKMGLIPCSGGIGLLSAIVGNGFARNWILSGMKVPTQALTSSGLVSNIYKVHNRLETIHEILNAIYQQSSTSRIQTKFGLYQYVATSSEGADQFEYQLAKASLISNDWKNSSANYENPRDIKNTYEFKLPKNPEES